MPSLTALLGVDGPIVEIAVGVSAARQAALRAAGISVAGPVLAKGLIDTGASCTCVDPTIVEQLGLTPTGTCPMHTPSSGTTAHICNLFDVAVAIYMDVDQVHVASFTLPVAEAELSYQGINALIGRDLLDKATLFYNGPKQTFVLSF